MALAVTTEGGRIFQRSGKIRQISTDYNIGLFVMAFRTGSSGQVLVFFYHLYMT